MTLGGSLAILFRVSGNRRLPDQVDTPTFFSFIRDIEMFDHQRVDGIRFAKVSGRAKKDLPK